MQQKASEKGRFGNAQRGQALLIVILIMVVSLTVGLSVASRSIVNLRTSTEEENSQRAFSAAEAGVEKAIATGLGISSSQDLGNNASIKEVTIGEVSGREFVLNAGNKVEKDQGIDLGLSQDYPGYATPQNINNLSIYWGSQSESCTDSPPSAAAIELIVIWEAAGSSPRSTRYAYDPCTRGNNFASAEEGSYIISGKTFKYKTSSIGINRGLVARVIPLYANTPVGINTCNSAGTSCTALPLQGTIIQSTGASGGTERKITYFQGYPQLPVEFFQYILFSP
ncbi:MAG: pilus assembly PilX N-terminal domain-containing protein [Candidatus Levybacteria bacterium]|nr:pilus assembly PilX N-terminal domain-containing protein [Candidatus Levybacteria bacterium]